MKISARLFLASTALSLGLTASAAYAQQAEPLDNGMADEIIVTAQKREQNLQDVPMTVNVVTGKAIEDLKIFDIREINTLAPGLSLQNTNGSEATISLRGVPYNPNTGAPDAVDIYLNEASFQSDSAFQALYDVGQIEVLRGPQGSLRGRTSPAGAITITTRQPNFDKIEGYVQGSLSDDGLYNLQGGVGGPIVQDKVAVRIAGLLDRNRLDQVRNITTGERNRRWVDSIRGTVAVKPTERLTVTAMYQYIDAKNRVSRQVIGEGSAVSGHGPLSADDRAAVVEVAPIYRKKSHVGILTADLDLDSVALHYIGSIQSNPAYNVVDQDPADAVPGYSAAQIVNSSQKLMTQELRLQSVGENFWNWMVGAYYERVRTKTFVTQTNDSFAPGLTTPVFSIGVGIDVPASANKIAFFMLHRFNLTDKLTLEGGLRYNRLKSRRQSTLNLDIPGLPLPPIDTIAPENEVVKENPFTGNASLTYEISPQATVYASYGRSFRPGNPAVGLTAALGQDLLVSNSETSDQVEIGFKGRTADDTLRLTVAAFYQKFKGFLSNTAGVYYRDPITGLVEDSFGFNFNGDAKVKGIEVQADLRPSRNFTLSINAAYARGRYDNALTPCNDFNQDGQPDAVGTPVVTPGQDVSRCVINGRIGEDPDFSLTLLPSFRHPIGSLEGFINGSFNFRPAFTSQTVAGYRYPSQEMLNLFAGLRDPRTGWELTLWAKNVFNLTRITSFSDSNALQGPFDSGYRISAVTAPREFGVTAKLDF